MASTSNSPCAACKFLRRKCQPECVFAPYFPPDQPQKFASVHKVFGASNVTKLLNELHPHQREDAVNSLAYQADMRIRDPVYGCVGVISLLQNQLRQLQMDLSCAKSELSKYQNHHIGGVGVSGGTITSHSLIAAAAAAAAATTHHNNLGINLIGNGGTGSSVPYHHHQFFPYQQQVIRTFDGTSMSYDASNLLGIGPMTQFPQPRVAGGDERKNQNRLSDKKQKLLSFQKDNVGGSNLLAVTFNKVRCRNALAKFVVKDEQAFRVVEGDGFKELLQELQPVFVVPSRVTIARDVHHLFCNKRMKLMKELTTTGQRVCLTTDCWTSRTQMSYMCLTAHYIDSDWKLQKKFINFCLISNHKGDTIGKAIETCLLDWRIEKVFMVTLDNASANDVAIGFVKRKVNAWRGAVLDGEYMHMRCGAHIVNLIVNEGLKEMHDSIAAIRNSVRYIRSSPSRLQKFRSCVEKEKFEYKGGLVLDIHTRWNSTYMMLDVALKFEKAFARYEEEDDKFLNYFMEKENGKKRIGPPNFMDWQAASIFVIFLNTFYEVTLKFSGTLHVTSNNFYHEICEVYTILSDLSASSDSSLSSMATSMKTKYDKY